MINCYGYGALVQIKMFKPPTCGYCPQQIEILEELDSAGVITFDPDENMLDATQNVDEANQYGVQTVPTTVLLAVSGNVLQRFVGLTQHENIEAAL